MIAEKQKRRLIDNFNEDYLGTTEVLNENTIDNFDFDQIPNPSNDWNDEENRPYMRELESFIIDLTSYIIKDGCFIMKSPFKTTKIDLTSANLVFGISRIPLSHGTHYAVEVSNGVTSGLVGYYPPFRKVHAYKQTEDLIALIEKYLVKNNLM